MFVFNNCNRKNIFVFIGLFVIIVLTSSIVFASGGGAHGAGSENNKLIDLLARTINFGVMVGILFIVIKKAKLTDFFSKRREEINEIHDRLNCEKNVGEERLNELAEKLQAFENEKKQILDQFRTEGLAEKDKIIAEAKERARQILVQADFTIKREIEAARERIKCEVIDMAAKRAQEIISKEINDSDQDKLINEFIQKVEKLH